MVTVWKFKFGELEMGTLGGLCCKLTLRRWKLKNQGILAEKDENCIMLFPFLF